MRGFYKVFMVFMVIGDGSAEYTLFHLSLSILSAHILRSFCIPANSSKKTKTPGNQSPILVLKDTDGRQKLPTKVPWDRS
jgi:hypothetical protein